MSRNRYVSLAVLVFSLFATATSYAASADIVEAAKKEAERLAEDRAARAAEEECEKARTEAIDKAKKVQWSARKALDECKSNYDKNLFALGNAKEHCKSAQSQLESARAQLSSAIAKTCTTASIIKRQ